MKYSALALGLCLTLAACAGAPPATQYYLLRGEPPTAVGQLTPSTRFAIGAVEVAAYIDQPGMVIETAPGELHAGKQHLWAEPMREAVRNFILVEVSRELGEDVFPRVFSEADTFFAVRIDQLHGAGDGQAVLAAFWWIRRGSEVLASYKFHETRALDTDGYAALARAEKALLADLAVKIADSLREAEPAAGS